MSVLLAILWKDLVTEWRSRDRVAAMLLFSLLVVMVFHFSLPGGATRQTAGLGARRCSGSPTSSRRCSG